MTATSASASKTSGADNVRGWDRKKMAARLARDIPEGWYVNLGIGIPLMVGDFIPPDREVVLQSENGIVGMGPLQTADNLDTWIVNAGKQNVTLMKGAAMVSHSDSFAMIRGGHLDLCVLGSFEVAANGDFANWTTSLKSVPAVGGAMDLAVGAQRIWLIMEHTAKDGKPRLLETCSMPLTAPGVVKRVYTNLAVIDVSKKGFELVDINPEITFEALQARTGAKLHKKMS